MVRSRFANGEVSGWGADTDRPRVLIEDADGAMTWAEQRILERAGFEVRTCDGPVAFRRGRCPLLEVGACPLVDGAETIICGLRLSDPETRALLAAHRSHDRPVLLFTTPQASQRWPEAEAACRPLSPFAGGDELVRAVRETSSPPPSRCSFR